MLVFIDDSGDAGFKTEEGSSSHFVIACVIFDDDLDAEETALKIKRLRRLLKWPDHREFKFNKCSKAIRSRFLQEVRSCKFRVRCIVVDKSKIRSPELRGNRESFYNYFIKEVLANSGGTIRDAKIRLDGHGDRVYKREAQTYFRRQLRSRQKIIRDVKFVDSESDQPDPAGRYGRGSDPPRRTGRKGRQS